MKDWKESNVNIVKECISTITIYSQESELFNKKAAHIVCPFLTEKLGDVKFKDISNIALTSIAELVTPCYVIK